MREKIYHPATSQATREEPPGKTVQLRSVRQEVCLQSPPERAHGRSHRGEALCLSGIATNAMSYVCIFLKKNLGQPGDGKQPFNREEILLLRSFKLGLRY